MVKVTIKHPSGTPFGQVSWEIDAEDGKEAKIRTEQALIILKEICPPEAGVKEQTPTNASTGPSTASQPHPRYSKKAMVVVTGKVYKISDVRQTKNGPVINVTVKTDKGYYQAAIWRNQPVRVVLERVKEGDSITVSGEYGEREYNGKIYKDLKNARISWDNPEYPHGLGTKDEMPQGDPEDGFADLDPGDKVKDSQFSTDITDMDTEPNF